ncbi:PEP-CTERM sorting domain-containing protein [Desulfovibrio psychrotolerans]|uniref:Ice-binding protein C-terminal domain-containing protein n=1 Tax=Desulfovibrio psychrotolerans TaxID=415242 RepID=A0A7J0BUC3_9BACT|nr:PEP-CTERM sorting domain-containing protein [Desulfovibrio psychrotolerans]GFM37317.1 hypothetical protein DSM19430T_20010 [Desulfovibrio psychrotolerans]
MKKIFSLLAATLLVFALTVPASAYVQDWTLDLSGAGGSTYTGVELLTVVGEGTVTQNLGGDGILNDGDTFSLSSYLATIQIINNNGNPFVDGSFFFHSTDLGGYVYNVVPGIGNPLGVSSLNYMYTTGSMQLYYGDHNNIAGSQLLMDMSFEYGKGDGAQPDLGGNLFSGATDMIFEFAASNPGTNLFSHASFGDLEEFLAANPLYQAFLVFDLNNNLLLNTFVMGDGFFDVGISVGGNVSLMVTPEPSTFLIFGLGLLGLIAFRKRMAQ